MKKVAFITLGCKVNQYDTEAMIELFEKEGYKVVDFNDKADVYVINTCTVTGLSDSKSRQMIRRAKRNNEDAIIVAAGCYAQTAPEMVKQLPEVDIIIGTNNRSRIIEYIRNFEKENGQISLVDDIMRVREYEDLGVTTYKGQTRAFIKIQEGCSQFCSYCIIPYARGPVRSRQPEDVIREVETVAKNGFKEIVLTGIHLASYGKDFDNYGLLEMICDLHKIDGIERIRLGSLEPTFITLDFLNRVKDLEKVCPHYHISLQSGCDATLKRMNRKYTTSQYKSVVELLREKIADVAVTTDVMVGFPGETDEEFEATCEFLKDLSLSRMHVFKYSPRKGTPAYKFPNQVEGEVKEERSKKLIKLSRDNEYKFIKSFSGREMGVLFEQEAESDPGFIEGLTSNYIKVRCKGSKTLLGKILKVRIKNAYFDHASGEIPEMPV